VFASYEAEEMGGRVLKKIAVTGQISKAKEIPEKIHLRYFLKFIGAVFSNRNSWNTK
jgi:hypothetical protein